MKRIALSLLALTIGFAIAQCPAAQTFIGYRKEDKNGYSVSSQSRSAGMYPSKPYSMSFIAQPGNEYRVTVKPADLEAGTVNFDVFEEKVVRTETNGTSSYKKEKVAIATDYDMNKLLEFKTDRSRKIFVDVRFSGGDAKKMNCVGVLIETKGTGKEGF